MTLRLSLILPHGSELVPEFGYRGRGVNRLIDAMKKVSEFVRKSEADTVVIATPHNVRVTGNIAVITSKYAEGKLEENGKEVRLSVRCDRELALKIVEETRKLGMPVVGVNYGTDEGKTSCIQLDWGSLIPLRFLIQKEKIKVLLISPCRDIELIGLVNFGKKVAKIMEKDKRNFVFVASADQAHTHSKNGPYGFSKYAKVYDNIVIKAIKENKLFSLVEIEKSIVEKAKPDSLWQILMLAGVVEETNLKGKILAYEVPSYFGMLCAVYEKAKAVK